MEKSKLYTSTGDKGMTSLVGGTRVRKNCARLEAYGTVDEFSSFLGMVASSPRCPESIRKELLDIQMKLFNIGGYLACEQSRNESAEAWGLTPKDILQLENWIDVHDSHTPEIRAFVLPEGSELSALTHVARTVCRRAERRILTLASEEEVAVNLLKYFNRLSDYLFILARRFNHIEGVEEIIWHKE